MYETRILFLEFRKKAKQRKRKKLIYFVEGKTPRQLWIAEKKFRRKKNVFAKKSLQNYFHCLIKFSFIKKTTEFVERKVSTRFFRERQINNETEPKIHKNTQKYKKIHKKNLTRLNDNFKRIRHIFPVQLRNAVYLDSLRSGDLFAAHTLEAVENSGHPNAFCDEGCEQGKL